MSSQKDTVLFILSETINDQLDISELENSLAISCTVITEPSPEKVLDSIPETDNPFDLAVLYLTCEHFETISIQIAAQKSRPFRRFVIVSESPLTFDMSPCWEVGMLGYVCLANGLNSLYQMIEAYFSPKNEIRQLKSQLKEASDLAVLAMSASSQLGEVIRFLELANQCAMPEDLGELMLSTMDKMGLTAALILRTEDSVTYCGPEEQEDQFRKILLKSQKERFEDVGQTTHVNFNTISGLIENMPGMDSEEQGRTKDTLFRLFEGGEERLKQIEIEQKIHKAERVRHQFLAILAHELRTPMNATLGFFRRLSKIEAGEVVNERHISALRTISEANERLANVIEDIVDLASVSAVEDIKKTRQIVWECCFGLISEAKKNAESKGLVLETDIDQSLDADIEPSRLQRVLKVILSNAVKYTEQGTITVIIMPIMSETGERVMIKVSDTGKGIDPERIKDIFEPFTIGSNHLTREHEGAGLGMAIAAEFTRELDGLIDISSEVGKGTTLTLDLPRYEAPKAGEGQDDMDVELF